jgi:hypothetical protein
MRSSWNSLLTLMAGLLAGSAIGADLSADQQGRIYGQCRVPCVNSMEASMFGEALKDKRFVFEAYCSCYCARISLRLSSAQLAQMGKDAVNSGHMFASKETRQFAEQAAQLCLAPFTMP